MKGMSKGGMIWLAVAVGLGVAVVAPLVAYLIGKAKAAASSVTGNAAA